MDTYCIPFPWSQRPATKLVHILKQFDYCHMFPLTVSAHHVQMSSVAKMYLPVVIFIGVALIGPLPECNGYRSIVTAVDYFTKWVKAEAIQIKSGIEVAGFLYCLQCRYRVTKIALTD